LVLSGQFCDEIKLRHIRDGLNKWQNLAELGYNRLRGFSVSEKEGVTEVKGFDSVGVDKVKQFANGSCHNFAVFVSGHLELEIWAESYSVERLRIAIVFL